MSFAPRRVGNKDLPRQVGRYVLLSILGDGGMARVFRAELRGPAGFRKTVALKFLAAAAGSNPGEGGRALSEEARLGALLCHPNVVDTYDLGELDGCPYIAMELVDGPSVAQLLAVYGPLPGPVAAEIGVQVCGGLAHAHDLAVDGRLVRFVHRDIKPANVLVSRNGVAKLVDFGIAKAEELTTGDTSTYSLKGTPKYMSPEQVSGDLLDRRSDIFAMGSLLHAMVSGESPFASPHVMRLISDIASASTALDYAGIAAAMNAALPGLGAIVCRCLQQDPAARFQNAEELGRALDALRPRPLDLRGWLREQVLPATSAAPDASPSAPCGETLKPEDIPETNIEHDPSSFVGRGKELAALEAALARARLVTVVGPGGAGKTRLCREYGLLLAEKGGPAGGVWFCDIGRASDLQGVLQPIADVLGSSLAAREDAAGLVARVGEAIAARRDVLLIVDNAEQVTAEVADALRRWLLQAREARFLVTSRERLRVEGEHLFRLDALSEEEAGQLFVERARAVRPGFLPAGDDASAVRTIVRRLDCLPLALELAASRVGVLPPQKLLERLTRRLDLLRSGYAGRAPRQATLRGAIDWSWDLLAPWERDCLAQCSLFAGGFFLEAAEAVVDLGAHEGAPWTLDVIEALHDKSLLRAEELPGLPGEPRFGMYETIREYAAERLAAGGGERAAASTLEAARRRHAEYYVRLAERIGAEHDPQEPAGMRRLALELGNLLRAHQRVASRDPVIAARIALALDPLLAQRGPFQTHIHLLDVAVAGLGDAASPLVRKLLSARARMRLRAAMADDADEDLRLLLELSRQAGDREAEGVGLSLSGYLSIIRGQTEDALATLGQALAVHREVADDRSALVTLQNLGLAESISGNPGGYVERLREALEMARRIGSRPGEADVLARLGYLLLVRSDLGAAAAHFDAALAIHQATRNDRRVPELLRYQGTLHMLSGDLDAADARFRKSIALARKVGAAGVEAYARANLGMLQHRRGKLDEALALYEAAIAVTTRLRFVQQSVLFRLFRAAALADLGRLDEAEAAHAELTEAHLALGEAAGGTLLRLVDAHIHLGRGRAAFRRGDAAEASSSARLARARIDDATAGGEDSAAASSEDVRIAIELLVRALDELRGQRASRG